MGPLYALPQELDFEGEGRERDTTKFALLINPFFNRGAAVISSIAATGRSDFSVVKGESTCGATLPAGHLCFIAIRFNPSSKRSRLGKLVITDNAVNSPQTVILDGKGEE